MTKKNERGGCMYSRNYKKALDVKDDGTAHSMCKRHRNYQVTKLRERRSKRVPRTFGPFQCQYPGGCKKERSIKLNGDRHWLCEQHRERQNALARERYKRKATNADSSNQHLSDAAPEGAASESTANQGSVEDVSEESGHDKRGNAQQKHTLPLATTADQVLAFPGRSIAAGERFDNPQKVSEHQDSASVVTTTAKPQCNIESVVQSTVYMLVPVTVAATQDRDVSLRGAIHATHSETWGVPSQATAATPRHSTPTSSSENVKPDIPHAPTNVRNTGNEVFPRAICDPVSDAERSQTLQRMAEDPRFMSICTEIWKMHHSATI